MNYFLILYCSLIIFILFKKINYEKFFSKCDFEPKGKFKKDCILECSKSGCDTQTCLDKCDRCKNYRKCQWLEVPTCKYEPKGQKIYDCIDECIGPRKIQWGGDSCIYPECKRICESCKKEEDCAWLEKLKPKKKCEFVPWGPDKQACIDRCSSSDRETWGGDECDVNTCTNICSSCTNQDYCEWKKKEPPTLEIGVKGLPPKQSIKLIPGNGEILIQWTPIHDINNPNDGYFLYYYKSSIPIHGVKVKKITDDNKTFSEYLLKNLDNNHNYSIVLIAYNKLGKGEQSNVIDTKPMDNIKLIYDNN